MVRSEFLFCFQIQMAQTDLMDLTVQTEMGKSVQQREIVSDTFQRAEPAIHCRGLCTFGNRSR